MCTMTVCGLRILNSYIRRNKLLTRLIFGVRIPDSNYIHWDFTTLALRKALKRMVRNKPNFLEIGTGPYAMLAIYLYRRGYLRIIANDINQDYVQSALKTVSLNDADFMIVKSDLFSNIKGKFDIILFNSVYIPRRKGQELMLNLIHQSETHWCGGDSGKEIIERFLKKAADHLSPDGAVFLGFNPYYLPEDRMHQIVKQYNYRVLHQTKSRFIPSTVFILKRDST